MLSTAIELAACESLCIINLSYNNIEVYQIIEIARIFAQKNNFVRLIIDTVLCDPIYREIANYNSEMHGLLKEIFSDKFPDDKVDLIGEYSNLKIELGLPAQEIDD